MIYVCFFVFTARCSYASVVLGVGILSVRPSICLSHAYFVSQSKELTSDIFITHERAVLLVF